ncbi:MAG: nucleoside triphosphate pyrophosphohydrolase family protein [Gemmatimonadota bacterium]|nr:MAG: nucleoside triphosphate pyrophosphohydrolase family protein [Gemmatimonadota bacterium]
MELSDYQERAHVTSLKTRYGEQEPMGRLLYPTLKLAGEAGEFGEKVGKLLRDRGGRISAEDSDALADELGDVLWYMAEVATVLGVNLDDVAQRNLEKLRSRAERGMLQGSGDNR